MKAFILLLVAGLSKVVLAQQTSDYERNLIQAVNVLNTSWKASTNEIFHSFSEEDFVTLLGDLHR